MKKAVMIIVLCIIMPVMCPAEDKGATFLDIKWWSSFGNADAQMKRKGYIYKKNQYESGTINYDNDPDEPADVAYKYSGTFGGRMADIFLRINYLECMYNTIFSN